MDASESKPTARSGQIGRYVVLKELGRGAFGVVYAADDPVLKRQVAIKLQSKSSSANSEDVLKEARAAARLRHPNLVAVYEVDVASGRPFVVSELIEGQSLASLIESSTLAPTQAATIVRDLARGLDYAHTQGLIHRDIKPHNILIDASGRPQIADFGLAVDRRDELQSQEAAYSHSGTLAYMAPEQAGIGGASVGPAVDQYALGATLFEILSGQRPHTGDSIEILKGLEAPEPPRLRDRMPGIPVDLDAICAKAMAHEPWKRYDCCGALADDLDRYLRGDLILGRKISPVETLKHFIKRHPKLTPWMVTGIVSAACILLITTALAIRGQFINQKFVQGSQSPTLLPATNLSAAQTSPTVEQLFPVETVEQVERSSTTDEPQVNFPNEVSAWLAYSRKLNKAAKSSQVQDIVSGLKLVNETVPALRHWEYGVLASEMDPQLTSWQAAAKRVVPVHGGQEIALLSDDNQLSLHELATGKEKSRISAGPMAAHSLCLLVQRPVLVFADGDSLRLWNYQENKELEKWTLGTTAVSSFAFSPDNKWLACRGENQNLAIYDVSTRKKHKDVALNALSMKFTEDSTGLIVGTNEQWMRITLPDCVAQPVGNAGGSFIVALFNEFPSGQPMAIANTQRVLQLHALGQNAPPTALADLRTAVSSSPACCTSNGHYLVAVSREDRMELICSFAPTQTISIADGLVRDVAFVDNARYLVASIVGPQGKNPRLSIWSVAQLLPAQTQDFVKHVASSPDGTRVAIGSFGSLAVHDAIDRKRLWQAEPGHNGIAGIAFHPNGQQVVTVCQDGALIFWNSSDGRRTRETASLVDNPGEIAFSPSGSQLAITAGAEVAIIDANECTVVKKLSKHQDRVAKVRYDSRGERLASCGDDGLVALWNASTGELMSEWSAVGEAVSDLSFTPDDQRLAVVVLPQHLCTDMKSEVRTRTITVSKNVNVQKTKTVTKTVMAEETRTRTVPETKITEVEEARDVEVDVDGKKRSVRVKIKVPKTEVVNRTETYTVSIPKQFTEEVPYTVQQTYMETMEQQYLVTIPVPRTFKFPAADKPGRPRVVRLDVADMTPRAQWIPEGGCIPNSLQYTQDGKRLLVSTNKGYSSVHPEFFFELLEIRGDACRSFAYNQDQKQLVGTTLKGLRWLRDLKGAPIGLSSAAELAWSKPSQQTPFIPMAVPTVDSSPPVPVPATKALPKPVPTRS